MERQEHDKYLSLLHLHLAFLLNYASLIFGAYLLPASGPSWLAGLSGRAVLTAEDRAGAVD